jgi:hypothetical protein
MGKQLKDNARQERHMLKRRSGLGPVKSFTIFGRGSGKITYHESVKHRGKHVYFKQT